MEEGCFDSPEMTAVRGGRADLKGLAERYDRLVRIEQSDWLSWGVMPRSLIERRENSNVA